MWEDSGRMFKFRGYGKDRKERARGSFQTPGLTINICTRHEN